MELVFNELSTSPLSENPHIANQKISQFIRTLRAFVETTQNGGKVLRAKSDFFNSVIAPDYSLRDWLNSPGNVTLKGALLGAYRYPYIEEDDNTGQDEFLSHRYFYEDEENGISRIECEGLAVAFIRSTLSVSLASSPSWERNILDVECVDEIDGLSEIVKINNVFSENCFNVDSIRHYLENNSLLELIESPIDPFEKRIHFRADHGTDVLQSFAEKLVYSPYITEVINSLEWAQWSNRFIRRIFANGIIYLTLHWDNRGVGMAIQTTGRNFRETSAIADLIAREFDS